MDNKSKEVVGASEQSIGDSGIWSVQLTARQWQGLLLQLFSALGGLLLMRQSCH